MSNKSKKALGQFYTTNNEYILQNITIPDDIVDIIEPFAVVILFPISCVVLLTL